MGMEKENVVMEGHHGAIPSEHTKEQTRQELWESIITALDVGADNLTFKMLMHVQGNNRCTDINRLSQNLFKIQSLFFNKKH